jgi:hypothetical protein
MKTRGHSGAKRCRESGQILPLCALWIVVLIPFVGLSIDLGFAYIAKAQLSKAVDAAALAGISNFFQKAPIPQNIAISTFNANFAPTGTLPSRYAAMPVPTVTFSTAANGNEMIQVQATATINTFFIRMLPAIGGANWNTLSVSDVGQATRAKVIMTLVLDHSGSMDPNCNLAGSDCSQGGTYLPTAVANFIDVFEDNVDEAAMVSFGATSVTNVAMETPFKSDITAAANKLQWTGGTFSHGGLSNALAINNSVTVAAGVNAVKVVVFFTDGMANMIQSRYGGCTGIPLQEWNCGGWLNTGDPVGFWSPNTANTCTNQECPPYVNTSGEYFTDDLTCGTITCGSEANPIPAFCSSATTFPSINGGTPPALTAPNIVTEAQARCIQVANQMRANGMYVYSIGLTASASPPDPLFLQLVANDPVLEQTDPGAFETNMPPGQAVTSGNGSDLNQLFQQIAGDIQERLTQ